MPVQPQLSQAKPSQTNGHTNAHIYVCIGVLWPAYLTMPLLSMLNHALPCRAISLCPMPHSKTKRIPCQLRHVNKANNNTKTALVVSSGSHTNCRCSHVENRLTNKPEVELKLEHVG
uniref:Uncharacterized protein n=1 Tax=Ceratitis capitata TaxID=7213 RepID=W8BV35_CERCA